MAYATSNPPALIAQAIGGGGQMWVYRSTDAGTVVDSASYFTNLADLGAVNGAGILVVDTDASPVEGAFAVINASTDITNATAQTDSD